MTKSTVTVIIPAYNAEKYLAQTIETVLQQTYTDFELLVVDDGSSDRTPDIVTDCSDPRVKLISQVNQGVSAARNTGIAHATGEFVAFLDSDDLWMPHKLETHVRHLQANPELGMSFARVEYLNPDGTRTGARTNLRLRNIKIQHLYYENLACTPSNVVVRRAVLPDTGGFDGGLSGFEDMEFSVRVSFWGWQVEGLDETLAFYRAHPFGISAQLYQMEKEWHLFNGKVKTYAPEMAEKHRFRAHAMALRYLARQSIRLRLAPDVGIEFMNRSLSIDWTLLFRQPKRTLLTLLTVYGRYLFPAPRRVQSQSR
jgi:glycosyltransferase involved in cell wall biosynthesis